ncbi:MAG: MlaD family protein [Pseudomonadota bacterium]
MLSRDGLEMSFSIIILFLCLFCIGYTYYNYFYDTKQYYTLYAEFNNVNNLFPGAKIVLSGVEIGYVHSLSLDNVNYSVKVVLHIDKSILIPVDSVIRIVSSSLFGGELSLFIDVNLAETTFMQPYDTFSLCYPVMTIDTLIAKFASKMIG